MAYYRYRKYYYPYRRKYYSNKYYRKKFKRFKTITSSNSTYLKLDGNFDIGYIRNNNGIRFITNLYAEIGNVVTIQNCFAKLTIWDHIDKIYNMMSIKGIKFKVNYNCTNPNSRISVITCFNPYVNQLSEADIMDANDKYIYNGLSGENKNYYKNLYGVNTLGYKQPCAIANKQNILGSIGLRESGEIKSQQQEGGNERVYTLVFTLYIKFFNSKK
jgi:hypothetical protein